MSGALKGLRQIGEIADPRNAKRLFDAGALDARSPLALARSLPWLIGRGPSLGVLTQMHAFAMGDKAALHDRHGTLTWKELDDRANQAAHALSRSGVRAGDTVALLLRNGREMAELILGAGKLGIVASPMNTWAKPKELKVTLEGAHPALLVYDTQHAEQVAAAAPEGLALLFVGDGGDLVRDATSYEALLAGQPASPPPPFTRNRGSARVVIHTSGTTGTPKGAERDSSAAGVGALANLLAVVPYRRDDIVFCPAPMFHSFGLATFTFASALGATMVLPEKFDPQESLSLIESHRATAASFVPVMIRRIVSLGEEVTSRYDLSSLRIVLASGSVLSEDLRRSATRIFGDVLYDLYGSTEIGWAAIATPEDLTSHPKSVGKPVRGIDIAVFSPSGDRLAPGKTGELYVKSNILFEGYTSGESKDERDGYMSIGDLGKLDRDGYLYVESRSDDMVVVGGENVYPIEVEQVIEDIDGVDEVAVLGVDDDEYGQVLAAFIVGSVSEEDVAGACKRELASFKVPRRIEIRDELPRTSTGKVIKRELTADLPGVAPLDES
ncbi:MAG: AMP-binding protein [Actinomycetota bacterium]|nr:AMP-binding protein [Actinomycetota bacterium]